MALSVQVTVVPVWDTHNEYAESVANILKEKGFRVDLDLSEQGMGKKVREAKSMKVPYILVLGDKEVGENAVTVESRDKGSLGQQSLDAFAAMLREEINTKAHHAPTPSAQ